MTPAWKSILVYGLVAATLLASLWLISLAPMRLHWGRELTGAAIAIVAMTIGGRLALRQHANRSDPNAHPKTPTTLPGSAPTTAPAASKTASVIDLSQREQQVLRLLDAGLSNKQLARELSVSENTIKTHLANLYTKLQASRRTEALANARRLGLFETPAR
jgi:ATP/maltotriose-dependent transcriptional regulator MalT